MPTALVVILILVPPLVPALIIRVFHVITKVLNSINHVIPLILNVLWNILDRLNLVSSPTSRVLREVLHIVNGIVVCVLGAADLLASPVCYVLGCVF
ncbi:hypothetical protein PtrM4_050550 [Pyrenophora tritici-repentis]|uniref:Uncharacterized protein n=1 Tax=Pyrenophora tritici-repentis TaxID=45151 RepID=A0A834RLD0_9PLEO|nr:hypothetical protein PtrM4_050550 [Pyrenophora tritici-repentis]